MAKKSPIVPDRAARATVDSFEIASAYLLEHRDLVPTEVFPVVHGAVRRRDLGLLMGSLEDFIFQDTLYSLETFRVLFQLRAFFRKNESLSESHTCKSAARVSFDSAEQACRDTNEFFSVFPEFGSSAEHGLVDRVKTHIANLLGPFGDFVAAIPDNIHVTSGATSTQPRSKSQPYKKMRKRYDCTVGCAPMLEALSKHLTGVKVETALVNANRIVLVPKDYKTHRTIACEPIGNLPFQHAVDGYLKKRMKRFGLDLSRQTRNQQLALEGSLHGTWATIDLSSASDTIANEVISLLFPPDWWKYLASIRSPCYSGAFGTGRYEKFSSMGNGATFVIETVLFWAIARACGVEDLCVYGDDIIVPTAKYMEVVRALEFFGFTTNNRKSFHTGPFRESCGGNYYSGVDVTPFYLRHERVRNFGDYHHLLNGLARVSRGGGALTALVKRLIRERKPLYGPPVEDTRSHLHLDPHFCYENGILRAERRQKSEKPWYGSIGYRGFVETRKSVRKPGERSYWLWFFETLGSRPMVGNRSYDIPTAAPLYLSRNDLQCYDRVSTSETDGMGFWRNQKFIPYRPWVETKAYHYANSVLYYI